MSKLKKGDIVGRISYGSDVLFEIKNIIKVSNSDDIYILKGITERIEADSPEVDLEKMDKRVVLGKMQEFEDKFSKRIQKCIENSSCCFCSAKKYFKLGLGGKRGEKNIYTGKILHLDGDKRYTEKSIKYYKSIGLNAIVKNIPESKQASVIKNLLERYKPDVLVITGHDGMIKKGMAFNDLYNYRNSRHFINTVNEARKWNAKGKELAIFARCLPKLL